MIMKQEEYMINGKKLVLRCARENEADMLIDYLKTVTGETRFLMCESDEVHYTEEQEIEFIRSYNESETGLLMLGFLDGEYVGNCSFTKKTGSRRAAHRAGVGIALFQKFTGQGIGKIMLKKLIEEAKKAKFEFCELIVYEGNDRAYKLYRKLGFVECGRIPKANKYADGTYADHILMQLKL